MSNQETNTANAAITTLSTTFGPTDLTATVASTSDMPTSPCYLVIDPDDDTKREVILFDGTFTGTTLVTSSVSNRYLAGSAAGSGITHDAGAKVVHVPVSQLFTDINDRVDQHAHTGGTDGAQVATSSLSGHDKTAHDALALDHGMLTGIADDDHTQYLNTARHDLTARHPLTVLGTDGLGLGLRNVQVYTAGATWTKPSWLRHAHVVAVGGGGGGGGSQTTTAAQASAGDGGSAGWVCEGSFAAGTLGATETVTIGAAGTGGAASTNGTDGGASSFGSHVVAPGGIGGFTRSAVATDSIAQDTATTGNGTAAGTIQRTGQAGEGAVRLGTSPVAKNGRGGSSPYGAGGRSTGALSTGDNGTGKGAGGAGGHSGYGNAGRAGGNGTAGLVIVYEYA